MNFSHTSVVSDVFTLCMLTIETGRLELTILKGTETVVLVDDALGRVIEAFGGSAVHPIAQLADAVPLYALVVETVRQLVSGHHSQSAVVYRYWEVGVEEGLLQDSRRKGDGIEFGLNECVVDNSA